MFITTTWAVIAHLLDENKTGEAYSIALDKINKLETSGLSRDIMNYQLISSLLEKEYYYLKPL